MSGRGEAVLSDGTRLEIRFIRPEDRDALERAFGRLSAASQAQRFLASIHGLSAAELRFLTDVDGDKHVAIVAVTDSLDLKEEVGLGVGRFIRVDDEPGVAEAAVTVADEAQGKGLGRLLLQHLAALAKERGIRTLRAEVLASNARIRRLLSEAGAELRADHGDTLVFEVALETVPDASESDRAHPLRRILRLAAETISAMSPRRT